MARVEDSSLHNFTTGEVVTESTLDQNFKVLQGAVNNNDKILEDLGINNFAPATFSSLLKTSTTFNQLKFGYVKQITDPLDTRITSLETAQTKPPIIEEVTATTDGQTIFILANNTYDVGKGEVEVEIDGVPQYSGEGFTETDPKTITLAEGVLTGTVVRVIISQTPVALSEKLLGYDNHFTSVDASLAEIVSLPADSTSTGLKNALFNVPDGGTLKIPKGTYTFTDLVNRTLTQGITIVGEKGTVIDMSTNTNMTPLMFNGTRGTSSPLVADATQYSNTFQSNISCNPGDVLLITSTDLWDSTRSYYYKGEMVEVDSVSSGTITIRGFLTDSYSAATTTVYLLTMPKIVIKDITIKRNSNQMGLYIQYAKNVVLENVSCTGARERCLWVDYCFGGEINNCYASDCWYSGSATSYGLTISSCQSINVNGGKYLGGRHGLTLTGAEPNRYINLYGVTVGNYAPALTSALDCHGNTEFINVNDCTILNGLLFEGTNYTIKNNRIISSTYNTTGLAIHTECPSKNGYLTIENNYITCLDSTSTGIDIQAIVANVTYKEIIVRDNKVKSSTQGLSLNPKDSTCTGFTIEVVTIENNDIVCDTARAILISNQSSTYTHIDKLTIDGGKYLSNTYRSLLISLDSTSDVEIKSAIFISNQLSDNACVVSGCRNLTIQNNNIKGNSTSPYSLTNLFNCSGILKIINNHLENFSANKGIRYDGTPAPTMAVLKDNTFTNCSGTIFKGAMSTYSYINQDGTGVV